MVQLDTSIPSLAPPLPSVPMRMFLLNPFTTQLSILPLEALYICMPYVESIRSPKVSPVRTMSRITKCDVTFATRTAGPAEVQVMDPPSRT